jgi:NAD-dependent SIR2 family protein deacetylase
MIPKWNCVKCTETFNGWAMYHRSKSHSLLCCPECGGLLELMNDTKAAAMIIDLIGGERSA